MLCCREENFNILMQEENTENFGRILVHMHAAFFFLPQHKTQQTKKRTNFSKQSFVLSFIHLIIVVTFCGVFLPRSEDHGESSASVAF